MDLDLYSDIISYLNNTIKAPSINDEILHKLHLKYPEIPQSQMRSIIGLWNQRRVSEASIRVKTLDIDALYKNARDKGITMACQFISQKYDYPPSLIAKVVVANYFSQRGLRRREKKAIKNLRKRECPQCHNNKSNTKWTVECDPFYEELLAKGKSLKKHNDPQVELVLNMFDEDTEMGQHMMEMLSQKNNDRPTSNVFLSSTNTVDNVHFNSRLTKSFNLDDSCSSIVSNAKERHEEKSLDSSSCNFLDDSFLSKFDTSVTISDVSNSNICVCSSDGEDSSSDEEDEYSVKDLLENTALIRDPILAKDVFSCLLMDDQYGITSDVIGNSTGKTYEMLLEKFAREAGLSFKTEGNLRHDGFDKTPDVILQIPVAVDGFIINWIESKALFADLKLHKELRKAQYMTYVHRFGPGLVIYWRGYVSDIPDLYLIEHKQILIRDSFPPLESFTFMDINKFETI